jgi:hypothetical protein
MSYLGELGYSPHAYRDATLVPREKGELNTYFLPPRRPVSA